MLGASQCIPLDWNRSILGGLLFPGWRLWKGNASGLDAAASQSPSIPCRRSMPLESRPAPEVPIFSSSRDSDPWGTTDGGVPAFQVTHVAEQKSGMGALAGMEHWERWNSQATCQGIEDPWVSFSGAPASDPIAVPSPKPFSRIPGAPGSCSKPIPNNGNASVGLQHSEGSAALQGRGGVQGSGQGWTGQHSQGIHSSVALRSCLLLPEQFPDQIPSSSWLWESPSLRTRRGQGGARRFHGLIPTCSRSSAQASWDPSLNSNRLFPSGSGSIPRERASMGRSPAASLAAGCQAGSRNTAPGVRGNQGLEGKGKGENPRGWDALPIGKPSGSLHLPQHSH